MVVQVLQFDLPPCGGLEDVMLAKCMVSLVRVVIVRVKVIVTAIVTMIEIEIVINYFEDGRRVSSKRFNWLLPKYM